MLIAFYQPTLQPHLLQRAMASAGDSQTSVAPELRRERERSALDVEELTNFLDGGEFITERRRAICEHAATCVGGIIVVWGCLWAVLQCRACLCAVCCSARVDCSRV